MEEIIKRNLAYHAYFSFLDELKESKKFRMCRQRGVDAMLKVFGFKLKRTKTAHHIYSRWSLLNK